MSIPATAVRTLLDYHYWASDRILSAVTSLTTAEFTQDRGNSFQSIRDTLAHTYFAEWAWYSRWQGNSPTAFPDAGRFTDVATLRAAWLTLQQDVRAYLDPLDDAQVQRVIAYRLLTGGEGASPIWQMVQHVVNHASYHRGQITTMLRQAGKEPAGSVDLIAFYRLRDAGKA